MRRSQRVGEPPLRVRADHWLSGARLLPSPHCDERPSPRDIELIVVHSISLPPGEFGGDHIDRLFLGELDAASHPAFRRLEGLRVAPHALVRRDGRTTQYVAFDRRAWHAGASRWRDRTECNDFSIGIELEGHDTTPYTDAQYDTLAALIGALLAHYPRLSPDAIAGHDQIARGRKRDPGPSFDWPRLRAALRRETAEFSGSGPGS